MEGSTIFLRTGRVSTSMQNSALCRICFKVCFSPPSGLRAIVSETIGGMTHYDSEEAERREISNWRSLSKLNGSDVARGNP